MTEVCCSTGLGLRPWLQPRHARRDLARGHDLARPLGRRREQLQLVDGALAGARLRAGGRPGLPGGGEPSGWNDGLLYYDPDFRSDGNQSIYFTRRYWVLANFSRYIRPGAVHYRVTGVPAGVHVLAFLRNTWRFVLINDAPRRAGGRRAPAAAGRPHATARPTAYTTSATSDLARRRRPVSTARRAR